MAFQSYTIIGYVGLCVSVCVLLQPPCTVFVITYLNNPKKILRHIFDVKKKNEVIAVYY